MIRKILFLTAILALPWIAPAQQVPDTLFRYPIKVKSYSPGSGPVVFIDQAHNNFHTRNAGFLAFSRLVEEDGYRVLPSGNDPISANDLAGCKILVIANPRHESNMEEWILPNPSAFTEKEIQILKKWVENGGRLLLIADHMPFAGAATELAKAFGFDFLNGFAYTRQNSWPPSIYSRKEGTLVDSPVINGNGKNEKIDSVATFTGSSFRIPEKALPVFKFLPGNFSLQPDTAWTFHPETPRQDLDGFFQGALLEYGKGRIAVFGEAAMFTAQIANGTLKAGFNSETAPQNAQFVLNVMHWLDTPTYAKDGKETTPLSYLGKSFSEIIYVERAQYVPDHHNSATMFQKGEINEASFTGPSALKVIDLNTGRSRTLWASKEGIIRDPEVSFDGKKIIFSMRNNKDDFYHIYEIDADGLNLKQLTSADYVTDIDPLYLPDGSIIFSSTREPKFCMCNRHIMANLFLMDGDGANIIQLGNSTLHEAHAALLNDGRIIYDRWEYVDRNFGDAQALWVVHPDGTKHSIYYGNNTPAPGGVIDARAIPGSQLIACIFGSCHDRPWGSLVLLDRRQGVDGVDPVTRIWPADAINRVAPVGDTRFEAWDAFVSLSVKYEDPFPLNENQILVSRYIQNPDGKYADKMGLYLVDASSNTETLLLEGELSVFDPQPLTERFKPAMLPTKRNFNGEPGLFYVQNVYEGTHMDGVEPGSVKYLRVVESPPKLNWTAQPWGGQGQHAPGMNWTNFENKQILGEVPVEEDGSAYFEVPSNRFVYFQLLDRDKKMIQSMRSGTMVQSGEVNGCIGCHEDRINVPPQSGRMAKALSRAPDPMKGWNGKEPELFSYMKTVQPILDRSCVKCHDFDINNRSKLVLASDQNPYFNASYIDLFVKKVVNVAGAGRAAIMQAYSWGSHASRLTEIIDGDHYDTKLSDPEKRILYAWMDINSVYYPVYESAYPANLAGRSPLDDNELKKLTDLTGIDFKKINDFNRKSGPQIAFERPDLSPCLDPIRNDQAKYREAVAIITLGGERLKVRPNGNMVENFVACDMDHERLQMYAFRMQEEQRLMKARAEGRKEYDKK